MLNIIFDFDGTLFRTETVDVEAFNSALESFGKKKLKEEEILSYIGLPMNKIAEKCLKTSDRMMIEAYSKQVAANEIKLIPKYAGMYPNALEILLMLSEDGHEMAICSNGSERYIKKLVEQFELAGYFKVVWHKRYGYSKSRGAKIVRWKMDANRRTVFIGDRKEDVDIAKTHGFISIGMLHGFCEGCELVDADFLAEDSNDLYRIIRKLEVE